MSHKTTLFRSFIWASIVWAVFSWPLITTVTTAVPASYKAETHSQRMMMPGDHLQLLYHFWLASDMITQDTPAGYNLYEFNTGEDEDRKEPGTYFLPFSLVFVIGNAVAGPAFGWNLTGLISLWMAVYLTVLLLRRYTTSPTLVWAFAVFTICFPYRWVTLMGGSPTGFAITLIPLLLLGIDMAVRDRRVLGGWLAGLAIVLACCADTHVFFFGVLAVPLWCIIAFLYDQCPSLKQKGTLPRLTLALSPIVLLTGFAYWLNTSISNKIEAASTKVRTEAEVYGFTPHWSGLFRIDTYLAPDNHVYLGFIILGLLACSLVILVALAIKHKQSTGMKALAVIALILSLFGIILLALGPKEELFTGRVWRLARMVVHPYQMIRQTDKIFCLVPTLIALAGVMSLSTISERLHIYRRWIAATALFACVLAAAEYRSQYSPTLSGVALSQEGYKAVQEDALAAGEDPRVVILPLWPGDSHYGSVYMHYCSLYRIRMINGYTPFPSADYVDNVVSPLSSMNQGWVTDEQLDQLVNRHKIRYIILHEDLFPEQVSPFPVTFTLERLRSHPRLELLKQSERIWTFKILDAPSATTAATPDWTLLMAARNWQAEHAHRTNVTHVSQSSETATGGDGYIRLTPESFVETRATQISPTPGLRYMVRLRGKGTIAATLIHPRGSVDLPSISVDTTEWIWAPVPIASITNYTRMHLRLAPTEGQVDIDQLLLHGGTWSPPALGETLTLDAPLFFHGGYTDPEQNAIQLLPEQDADSIIIYGPKLPLDPGTYELEVLYDVPEGTPADAVIAFYDVRWVDHILNNPVDITASNTPVYTFTQSNNLPITICFVYTRQAAMTVKGFALKRTK